jgi:hypothetical protein
MKTLRESLYRGTRVGNRFLSGFGLRLALFGIWLALLSNPVSAETFGDFSFTDDGAAITITGFLKAFPPATVPVQEVQIPAIIKGKPVTVIGTSAFAWQASLKRVSIPASVTQIDSGAFFGCQGLTAMTIPERVAMIGDSTFENCSGLASVEFLGDAPMLGQTVFSGTASGFEVRYHNGKNGFASPDWNGYPSVNIDATPLPLSISTTALSPGNTGVAYLQALEAEGGVMPRTWSVPSPGTLPPGLSLSEDGVIFGTPTTAGDFVVPIQVTGSDGTFSTNDFLLTIYPGSVFSITTNGTLTAGTVGFSYTPTSLATSGGVFPLTWTVATGSSLPEGMTLSSFGVISGTPTRAARSTFTVQATDTRGVIARKVFSIVSWNQIPNPLPSGVVGSSYSKVLSVTAGVAPRTWALAPGSALPPGLTLANDGTISGIPETPGSFLFSVQVSDGAGFVSTIDLNLAIAAEVTAHLVKTSFDPGLRNATIAAFRRDNLIAPPVVTMADSSGRYDIGVTGGEWDLYLVANTAATEKILTARTYSPIGVSDGEVRTGNFVQDYAIPSQSFTTISGRVVDGNGNPAAGVYVWATGSQYKAVALTDRDGRYWLPYKVGIFQYVDVLFPGYEQQSVSEALPVNAPVINFAPRAVTAHIQGRLTADGVAIPGALVEAALYVFDARYGQWIPSEYTMQAMTNANGDFDLPVSGGRWEIYFPSVPGSENLLFPPWYGEISLADGETVAGVSRNFLHSTGTISGTVRDAAGQPLGGVFIEAVSWINGAPFSQSGMTDAEGQYSIPVGDGYWSVSVLYGWDYSYDSYEFAEVEVIGSSVVNFQPNSHVQGTVLMDGEPVSGVTVDLGNQSAVTDGNGNYDIWIRQGTWTVSIHPLDKGWHSISREVSVETGQTVASVNLVIPGTSNHSLSGTVTDINGLPVSFSEVAVQGVSNGVTYSAWLGTDANGQYSLPVLDGTWTVDVSGLDWSFPRKTISISGNTTLDFSSPAVTTQITGTVTKDGVPYANARIHARRLGDESYGFVVQADADGAYSVGVQDGSWTVRLDPYVYTEEPPYGLDLYLHPASQEVIVAGEQPVSGINLAAFTPHFLFVWTVDSNGQSMSLPSVVTGQINGETVSLSILSGNTLQVPSGEWTVSVEGFGSASVTIDDSDANVLFDAPQANSRIQGRIALNGNSMGGVVVSAVPDQGGLGTSTTTDASGRFDLGVLAGAHTISGYSSYESGYEFLVWPLATVNVGEGQTVTDIDIQPLPATGTISGTVKDANNQPVSGMDVEGTCTIAEVRYASYGYTDSNGAYSFPVIDGSWDVDVLEESGDIYDPQAINVIGSAVVDFGPRLSAPPIIITPSPLAAGAVGAAYNQALSASGGTPPYTWSLAEGSSLPDGLSLGTDGVISGTPNTAVSGIFTIRVTGSDNTSSTAEFSLTITSPSATWQGTQFTPEDVATGLTTLTADFDRDGLPNLFEYAFRKNPKVPDAAGITPGVNANKMSISFPCDATCTDIIYTVQASSNLSAWEDIAESVGGTVTVQKNGSGCAISDTGNDLRTVTVTEAAPFTGKRFLRVKVSSP